jgi:hypothetical protein
MCSGVQDMSQLFDVFVGAQCYTVSGSIGLFIACYDVNVMQLVGELAIT